MNKSIIWIGVIVGSTIGGFIPAMWGASFFSFSSLFLSTVGGLAGVYLGYKINERYF